MKTFQTFDISAEYDAIHRTFPCHKDAPVIGLTGNFQEGACTLLEGYFTSILKAGGIPLSACILLILSCQRRLCYPSF